MSVDEIEAEKVSASVGMLSVVEQEPVALGSQEPNLRNGIGKLSVYGGCILNPLFTSISKDLPTRLRVGSSRNESPENFGTKYAGARVVV